MPLAYVNEALDAASAVFTLSRYDINTLGVVERLFDIREVWVPTSEASVGVIFVTGPNVPPIAYVNKAPDCASALLFLSTDALNTPGLVRRLVDIGSEMGW